MKTKQLVVFFMKQKNYMRKKNDGKKRSTVFEYVCVIVTDNIHLC